MAIGDLAEAAALAGRPQAGRERLAEVEALVGDAPAEWIAINLRHARAVLADDEREAAVRFDEALARTSIAGRSGVAGCCSPTGGGCAAAARDGVPGIAA